MNRRDIDLTQAERVALAGENNRGTAVAIKVIARRALLAEHGGRQPTRPKHKRPKVIRTATLLGGLLLALTAAGCIPVPPDVVHNERSPATCQEDESCWDCSVDGNRVCGPQVGDPVSIVALDCRTPDGYPFTYTGPAETAPYEQCGLPPLLQRGPK